MIVSVPFETKLLIRLLYSRNKIPDGQFIRSKTAELSKVF